MSKLYTCEPQPGAFGAGRIVVGWSAAEGLHGPDAHVLRDLMQTGRVSFGGYPRAVVPAPKAIESLGDLALLIGDSWCLPPELVPHYPPEPVYDPVPGLCN